MVIFALYGYDELAMLRRLAELKAEVGDSPETLQGNVITIDAASTKVPEIIAPAMMPPFLAPRRLVIIEHLLERAAGGRGRSRSAGQFEPVFDAFAAGLPSTTTVVFTWFAERGGASRPNFAGNPGIERIKQMGGQAIEFPELKPQQFIRFIREEANAHGIRFRRGKSTAPYPADEEFRRPPGDDPVQLLAELHPSDTLAIDMELRKLALYTRGRDATIDDVNLLCAGERAYTTFQMVDALQEGNLKLAMAAYRVLFESGKDEQYALATITGRYRQLVTILDILDRGAETELQRLPGIGRYPQLVDKAVARAVRHGWPGVHEAWKAVVETDRAIKMGELRAEVGMDLLLARLASIPRRSAARAG